MGIDNFKFQMLNSNTIAKDSEDQVDLKTIIQDQKRIDQMEWDNFLSPHSIKLFKHTGIQNSVSLIPETRKHKIWKGDRMKTI